MPEKRPRGLVGSDPKQPVIHAMGYSDDGVGMPEVRRSEGMADHAKMGDSGVFTYLALRLVILPIWLPYKGWKIIRQRRQMTKLAIARAGNVAVVTDDVVREIMLEWVEDHPSDYPMGVYDPKVMKLQRTFKKILDRHT